MKTALILTIILLVYKLYQKEEKTQENQSIVANFRYKVVLSDTTNTFHSDFDSIYTFDNGKCIAYTFKKQHICNGN